MSAPFYKILRILAILFMSFAVALTLLGGIGSTCAAFLTENFASMSPLLPYRWLYQLLVVISVLAGVWGIRALIGLVKGEAWAFRETILVLVIGGASALIQIIASRTLRGSSMPTDVRLYATILALIVFLILRLTGIWEKLHFNRQQDNLKGAAGGLAMINLGLMVITIHLWAGPSHMLDGLNYANVWNLPMTVTGTTLLIYGFILTINSFPKVSMTETKFISGQPESSGTI